jgi:hypothetical protein
VAASTTTTIRGVSILSRQGRPRADVFDIALSPEAIVIRRPGRADQRMGWDRISQWELEERPDCIVLTLRGGGSVTPLVVKGWTFDDLETVMRQATEGREVPEVTADAAPGDGGTPGTGSAGEGDGVPSPRTPGVRGQTRSRPRRPAWRPIVTVVLLALLATAVTLVLLQSAGVISWGFLGPTA